MSSLGFLLGSSAPEGFFRASHERAPALLEGRDEEGGPVLSNARLRLLLALGWIRCPLLRLERAGEDLPEAAFSSGLRFGAHAVDGLAEPEAVARLLASGASLEALHVERAWRPLADVCAGLSRELHAAVTAHAWLLPLAEARVGSDAALLAPRVARVDTFLVQLAGTTRCRVWRGPQDLPLRERPTTEQAGRAACDVPPLLTAVMRPGERVYVPRGFVYAREACSAEAPAFAEDSLGLAVELASPTWVNVFGALLKTSLARLITDPRLRRGLGPDEAPTSEDRAALGAQLARDLRFGDAAWMLVQEASMKQGPSRAGALAASLQREGIGPESLLRRREEILCHFSARDDGGLALAFDGKEVVIPASTRALTGPLAPLMAMTPYRLGDVLDGVASSQGRAAVVSVARQLVTAGLLTWLSPPRTDPSSPAPKTPVSPARRPS